MGIDFLFIFKALIIAVVEGLTEFVPVSSTGHMILVGDLIHFNTQSGGFPEMYEVVIQLGAILAVVVLYWRKISDSVVEFFSYIFAFILSKTSGDKRLYESKLAKSETGFRFGINVIIGTIPAAILGLLFHDEIKKYLFSTKTVAIGFIVGGILLIVVENNFRRRAKRSKVVKDIDKISYKQSLLVGCFQCLSLWPGMSRSASTIMGGWISGLNTTIATEFTFFLAIPAMIGASGLDLFKFDYSQMNATNWIALILGFIVAFIVSLVVINKFINYLKKKPMRIFAIYRVFAGILLAILIFTGVIS
ncbi:undecaprenyl-diphosphate phosphatase [Clostridium sp. LIBA-8841]|uniref:undecaprenyl-diphosphate phosphatase n=1 Tax=Clostridium sp. LIBA-8841 TaxID=2987530 RepID=UPI002AC4FE1F|nr:undecaprenyl-diphosphate phosphatase [Clostridium sp. LIBA-8841]MDZ5253246.1 undecaprenyl-diphosphate phosphatase [Clostridium sp. LIBA-8841]